MFPTTHRSAVQGVRSTDAQERSRAFETLVEAYWKPAYLHLRLKWKLDAAAAEDAVQGFFARALERGFFEGYDPAKARFRTFFKLCLDRHQSHAHEKAARAAHVDFSEAESEVERAAKHDPEHVFDLEWKRQLFSAAIEKARAELDPVIFRIFEQYDLCEPPRPRYEDLARAHGLAVTTITNHLAKARRTLRAHVQVQLDALEDAL
jgi:RNA polymerase sigma factor (sigma-70 family)